MTADLGAFFRTGKTDGRFRDRYRLFRIGSAIVSFIAVIAPIISGIIDQDFAPNIFAIVFGSTVPNIPDVTGIDEATQKSLGQFWRGTTGIVIYYFVAILITCLSYFSGIKNDLSGKLQSENEKNRDYQLAIMEIRESVTTPRYREKVTIGIFDNLIIYAPMFAAEGLGYFDDEHLEVIFEKIGDDDQVAEAVRAGRIPFGACDPVCCLPSGAPDGLKRDNDLLILMPLAKRFGITAFGKMDIVAKLKSNAQQQIMICSYEKGSTTYLTAEIFRRWLSDRIASLTGVSKTAALPRIEVQELDVKDDAFSDPSILAQRMQKADFILLWEPQTSWVIDQARATFKQFGVVAARVQEGQDGDPIAVLQKRPTGVRGLLDETGSWKAWTPANGRRDSHRCLVSGLMTTRYILERRPELCRRVFSAISRACIRLHGLDWELDQAAHDNASVFKRIVDHLSTQDYIEPAVLRAMVSPEGHESEKARERGGVFPFVHGVQAYDPDGYRAHLMHCHRLWHESDRTLEKPWAVKEYGQFFAKPAQLNKLA